MMSPWCTFSAEPNFVNLSQLRNVSFVLQKYQHRHKLWFEKYKKIWLKISKKNNTQPYIVSSKYTDAHFISSSIIFLYMLQCFALIDFSSISNCWSWKEKKKCTKIRVLKRKFKKKNTKVESIVEKTK